LVILLDILKKYLITQKERIMSSDMIRALSVPNTCPVAIDILSHFLYPQFIRPDNHSGNAMHMKTFSIKGFLILCLLVGWTTFLLISFSFAGEPIRTVTGKVTKVSDGDTIHVTTPEKTKLRVRLYDMDAPETPKINQRTGHINKPGQPFGEESWKALEVQIMGKHVRMDIIDIDRNKRMVRIIWIGDRNINLELVEEGYAEAYLEYLKEPYRAQYIRAEREARSAGRGIWSLPGYERPNDFRKRLNVRGGNG
jgi:micrococcal nuclease